MRKLTQKDDIGALLKDERLYMIHHSGPVRVKRMIYLPGSGNWLIFVIDLSAETMGCEELYKRLCVDEAFTTWSTPGISYIESVYQAMRSEYTNKIFEQVTNKTMIKQEIELKEGMTARVEGCKVIIETPEWKPKVGDVVTTISPRGKTISIYKSGNVSVGCVWDFYASIHYANGLRVEEQMMDYFGDGKTRLSTYDERCTFFARLVAEGYKWNAKKLKLTKVGKKWSPADGDFVYYAENDKTNEAVSIYKDVNYSYASILVRSGNLESFTASVAFSKPSRAATDPERQKLLDELAKIGKKWNATKKRIEDIEPTVVEMTMEQVCEKLGMNVKIVKK